ncbi:exopolysaccharide transport family protein [Rhodoplanes roseus]|uniref:exopolysaccharide transport family protein n=1 Tax=Rhodoplanes roseus TaxID=29409 RepID=UPI001FDFC57C|nr:exopolysaccharide transport family protein [Rhodoplanes roseus]
MAFGSDGGAIDQRVGELDMRSIGRALWRRKWMIVAPTVLVALLAAVAVNLMTPRYKSEARLLYEGRENVFLRPEADRNSMDRSAADQEAMTSQVQLVLSRELASQVIAELKLAERPEFDPLIEGLSPLKRVTVALGISRDPYRMSAEERVLDAYYERLTAYAVDKSRVITLEFQSYDPVLAARVANAIAQGYLKLQQGNKQEEMQAASRWLSGEIERLRREVAEAEARSEEFRSRSNLFVGTNNTTLSNQQLGEFNTQLGAARARKADLETRARLLRDMLRRGDAIEASEIANSEFIRRLSEQRVALRAQLAEQYSTLLDNHPRIKELKAQISDYDRQIRSEAEKLIRTLENDAKEAAERVTKLSSELDNLKRQAATSNEDDVRLRAFERDAKSKRDLLENYLGKYREASARESIGSAPADARIISRAIVSNTPFFPKKMPIILVATLATFFVCAGIVTAGELMRAAAPVPAGLPQPEPLYREPAMHREPTVRRDATVMAPPPVRREALEEPARPGRRLFGRTLWAERTPPAIPSLPPQTAHQDETSDARPAEPIDLDEAPPHGTVEAPATAAAQSVEPEAFASGEPLRDEPLPDEPLRDEPLQDGSVADVVAHDTEQDGTTLSSIDELARRLREGAIGRQVAVFGTAPDGRTTQAAAAVARLLARDELVVLVRLGAEPAGATGPAIGGDGPGVTDMIRGEATFGEIIARDKLSRAHVVPRGRGDADTGALLASLRFVTMIDALARTYDHVIIDVGAFDAVAADQMAELASGGVLVVPETSDPIAGVARDSLAAAGYGDDLIVLAGAPLVAPTPQPEAA